MHSLAFICVDYNGREHTEKMCESLRNQLGFGSKFSIHCIVVDNAASAANNLDLSDSLKKYGWVKYIQSPTNLGYFGGLNFGLQQIAASEFKYVVICNNDLIFENNFCSSLIEKKYAEKILSVCPDVITKDGIHQNPHNFKRISWLRRLQFDLHFSNYYVARLILLILQFLRPVKMSPPQPPVGCEIHMGVGACYVLTSEFLKRFKKLNFPHFLYAEEAYFSDQIHSSGGILWFDPDLRVYHAESASLSKIPKKTTYEFARTSYWGCRKFLMKKYKE